MDIVVEGRKKFLQNRDGTRIELHHKRGKGWGYIEKYSGKYPEGRSYYGERWVKVVDEEGLGRVFESDTLQPRFFNSAGAIQKWMDEKDK